MFIETNRTRNKGEPIHTKKGHSNIVDTDKHQKTTTTMKYSNDDVTKVETTILKNNPPRKVETDFEPNNKKNQNSLELSNIRTIKHSIPQIR